MISLCKSLNTTGASDDGMIFFFLGGGGGFVNRDGGLESVPEPTPTKLGRLGSYSRQKKGGSCYATEINVFFSLHSFNESISLVFSKIQENKNSRK